VRLPPEGAASAVAVPSVVGSEAEASASVAKYRYGQIVHHKTFDYRGVVVDVHPQFQGTEEWYDRATRTEPPKDQPWYEVLVHDKGVETYVAQENLEPDDTQDPVEHPLVRVFFNEFSDGTYKVSGLTN